MLKSKILIETLSGINQYDFEARTLIPQTGMFTTPDPKASRNFFYNRKIIHHQMIISSPVGFPTPKSWNNRR